MAAEAASFNTSKDSTSFMSKFPRNSGSTTTPSTTTAGPESAVIEPKPRIVMVGAPPASGLVAWIFTPETCPISASSTRATAI